MINVKTEEEKIPIENTGFDFTMHIASEDLCNITRVLSTSLVLPELNQTSGPLIKSS